MDGLNDRGPFRVLDWGVNGQRNSSYLQYCLKPRLCGCLVLCNDQRLCAGTEDKVSVGGTGTTVEGKGERADGGEEKD